MRKSFKFSALCFGMAAMFTFGLCSQSWAENSPKGNQLNKSEIQKPPSVSIQKSGSVKHVWTTAEMLSFYQQMQELGLPELDLTAEQILDIANSEPYDVPSEYLTAEVMTAVMVLHEGEFYMDDQGLHWGDPQLAQEGRYHTMGTCSSPIYYSVIRDGNGVHYLYWFNYLPSSYDVYLGGYKIHADRYAPHNALMVSGWDMCLHVPYCSPSRTLSYLQVCAK